MNTTSYQPLAGTFLAKKKNGDIYFRSSVTFKGKHISLGGYAFQQQAHLAYKEALSVLNAPAAEKPGIKEYSEKNILPFGKWVSLINFRDNGIYIKNPIYLKKNHLEYYYAPNELYLFDIDDLFYYSEHKIMKRNGHIFVSDYGMQVTILSRYGIRSHAVAGKDYVFANGNSHDLRYENIRIINPYYGVRELNRHGKTVYQAKIHINGDYLIGTYDSAIDGAIAYNKAVDILKANGSPKKYQQNYIECLTGKQYAEIYSKVDISPSICALKF